MTYKALALALEVRPVLGRAVDEAVRDGCHLACSLGLAYVSFEGNEQQFTCYADGTAQKWYSGVTVDLKYQDRWVARGLLTPRTQTGSEIEWTHIPPVRSGH
jgi:hypothetical protein